MPIFSIDDNESSLKDEAMAKHPAVQHKPSKEYSGEFDVTGGPSTPKSSTGRSTNSVLRRSGDMLRSEGIKARRYTSKLTPSKRKVTPETKAKAKKLKGHKFGSVERRKKIRP